MERALSPELALVDPELAAVLRRSLPDPGCFVPASLSGLQLSAARAAPAPSSHVARGRRDRRWPAIAATSVVTAAVVVAGLLIGRPELPAAESSAVARPAGPGASAASIERASRRYAWSAVPGAREYEVTLHRGRAVVYRTTAREPVVTVPRTLRLGPGRYTWVVEAAGSTRQVPLLESTFLVPG